MKTCKVDGCAKPVEKIGMCGMHYQRLRKHGDPHHVAQVRGDNAKRFASKVRVDESGCHVWTSPLNSKGYGVFWNGKREGVAHRWAWEQIHGPVPEGLELDHLCRNRACVNPDHLEPVTHAENMRRAQEARTHCIRGHAYAEHGRINSQGPHFCDVCERIRVKARRERREAA